MTTNEALPLNTVSEELETEENINFKITYGEPTEFEKKQPNLYKYFDDRTKLKTWICYLKALPLFFKYGCQKDYFCPHQKSRELIRYRNVDLFVTDKTFRIATNYTHYPNEQFVHNATVEKMHCIFCGGEEYSWFRGDYDDLVVLPNFEEEN